MRNASSIDSTASTPKLTDAQLVTSTGLGASLVTLTSFLTETVHPTRTYTEVTTIANDLVTAELVTSQLITATHSETLQSGITLSQTYRPQTPWPESTQAETQQETVQQTPSPTPIASSMPPWTTSDAPVSSSSESQPPLLGQSHVNAYTSESDPVPLAATSSTSSSSLMATHSIPASSESRGTPGLQVVTSTQRGTSTQSSTAVSTSSSDWPTSSPLASVISGSTDSSEAASSQKSSSHKVGAIIGGAVGGAVFIVLALVVCFLFRRRRRNTLHRRQHSRQKLLRSDSENSANAFLHTRQLSWPTIHSSAISSAPLLPPQRKYSHPDTRLNPALVASNQDLSLDRMYLHNEHQQRFTDGPSSDPENGPIIEVSPPTRSASIYSRSSWDGGLKFLELYDSSSRSSPGGSTYYPGGSTATLPGPGDDTPNSQKLATPKRRASIRSNPFDLEAPPSAVSWGQVPRLPLGPPNPAWGRWH